MKISILLFFSLNLIKSGLLYEVHLNILNIYTQFDTDTKTCKNQKDMFVIKNVKVQYVINVLGRTSLKIENFTQVIEMKLVTFEIQSNDYGNYTV